MRITQLPGRDRSMWAVMSIGLLIATLGQATQGSAGIAISLGAMLAVVLAVTAILRHKRRSTPS
jgi:hypothetical protein